MNTNKYSNQHNCVRVFVWVFAYRNVCACVCVCVCVSVLRLSQKVGQHTQIITQILERTHFRLTHRKCTFVRQTERGRGRLKER